MNRPLGKLTLLAIAGSVLLGACSNPASDFAPTRNPANLSSVLWTRQFGTRHDDWATSMAVDQQGNILSSGYTKGSLPGQAHYGRRDAFVRKYDPAGNELWTRQLESGDEDITTAIGVDRAGNVLVAGYTKGTLPGQTHVGHQDAFLLKYDPEGNELLARQFGSSGDDVVRAIAVDHGGNVLTAGFTKGTLPGQTHLGDADAFVRKYGPFPHLAQGVGSGDPKTVAIRPKEKS